MIIYFPEASKQSLLSIVRIHAINTKHFGESIVENLAQKNIGSYIANATNARSMTTRSMSRANISTTKCDNNEIIAPQPQQAPNITKAAEQCNKPTIKFRIITKQALQDWNNNSNYTNKTQSIHNWLDSTVHAQNGPHNPKPDMG